jgi:ABC-2 type transport system ATP-binding protein
VGALIESAAFVPHLSGMRNLRLWWEANGARWSEAHVDDALAIADLGTAIDRKVKTYSQGMRQRLGLARVLLGQPEVLVLDEPTNGLDPQEMREVRQLVHRVAAAGATVLFSSHVLAEVEQTCTHAVVMDRGKFVAGGSVASLIGTAGSVYLEVTDVGRAQQVLDAFPGIVSVTPEAPGLSVDMRDNGSRAELVKALVDAGVGVDTVVVRRRLEDAFLGLVEAERS